MRLHTDNPLTMPVTDALYGKGGRRKPAPAQRPPRVRQFWEAIDLHTLDELAKRYGGEAVRFAGRRHALGG